MALIATRRAQEIKEPGINLQGPYLLNDVLQSEEAPLDEFSKAGSVIIEAPPVASSGYEQKMTALIHKVRALGVRHAVVVMPSLRRKTNKSLWVSKWNRNTSSPFVFHQYCSCKFGSDHGSHLAVYIGCSESLSVDACPCVPTLSTCRQASVESLSLIVEKIGLILDRPPSNEGAHRVPDSAVFTTSVAISGSASALEGRPADQQGKAEACFPTEAKVLEKQRKLADKAQGVERPVKKRVKVVEDHHDDCGNDLSSLDGREVSAFTAPCDYNTDEEFEDEYSNMCLLSELGQSVLCFPIDVSKVAKAQPGEPHKGTYPTGSESDRFPVYWLPTFQSQT